MAIGQIVIHLNLHGQMSMFMTKKFIVYIYAVAAVRVHPAADHIHHPAVGLHRVPQVHRAAQALQVPLAVALLPSQNQRLRNPLWRNLARGRNQRSPLQYHEESQGEDLVVCIEVFCVQAIIRHCL